MDMEINQYIDEHLLPSGELSMDEYKHLVSQIKHDYQNALDNGVSEEELLKIKNSIPNRGILIKDYDDMNLLTKAGTDYYYNKLKEAEEEKEKNGTSGSPNMDELLDDMRNGETDDHGSWDEFEDMPDIEKKLIEKQVQKLLSDAKENTIKKRGTVPGEIEGLIIIEEIIPPKFDWKGYIRRFTGNSSKTFTKKSRRKENRKFPETAGLKIKLKQHILVAIDTSASVNDSELKEFINELYHIYKTGVMITIVQCDTQIRDISEYKGKFELLITGRGGTEFDPVIEYYNIHKQKYTALIYFTDGECSASIKPLNKILWVLSERSYLNTELPGQVIKLEL